MALRIRTLGSLSFVAGGADVAALLEQPVRAALLVVLAVEREIARERLLGLLWPERDPAHARHALNQTLHLLRRDLGADLWEAEGDRLRAAPWLEADVPGFRAALACERWDDALRPCEGEFLVGWYLAASPWTGGSASSPIRPTLLRSAPARVSSSSRPRTETR